MRSLHVPGRPSETRRPIFFTHIQKTGGTTVEFVLRRYLGLRHLDVLPRIGWIYDRHDLRADQRLNPWAFSFAGHWLRPFVDFDGAADAIMWYTMLREPISRYLSHRRYHVERMGFKSSFDKWLDKPHFHNLQTQLIAGEQNVQRAKAIVEQRLQTIGLLERFDESLLLFRRALGLPGMQVGYGRPKNTSRMTRSEELRFREEAHRNVDRLRENNKLDIELYGFVTDVLFPRQVAAYGPNQLAADLETQFSRDKDGQLSGRVRAHAAAAFKLGVYRPVHRLRARAARRRGEPEERR